MDRLHQRINTIFGEMSLDRAVDRIRTTTVCDAEDEDLAFDFPSSGPFFGVRYSCSSYAMEEGLKERSFHRSAGKDSCADVAASIQVPKLSHESYILYVPLA